MYDLNIHTHSINAAERFPINFNEYQSEDTFFPKEKHLDLLVQVKSSPL